MKGTIRYRFDVFFDVPFYVPFELPITNPARIREFVRNPVIVEAAARDAGIDPAKTGTVDCLVLDEDGFKVDMVYDVGRGDAETFC